MGMIEVFRVEGDTELWWRWASGSRVSRDASAWSISQIVGRVAEPPASPT